MIQFTTDVLIIGAGPTGTTLALELAAQNISFRLIDKASQRSDKSRALAVHSRSMEVLDRHAPVQGLMDVGNRASGILYYIHGKQVTDLNMNNVRAGEDTEFPQILMISQIDTERFLDHSLAGKYGRAAEFGIEATSIVQDADGVTVVLRKVQQHDSGSDATADEIMRAKYVVGADGSHSAVRHAAPSITFDGSAYPQDFILCDTHIRNTTLRRDRITFCSGWGLMIVFPLKDGMVRVVVSRAGHRADEDKPVLADFQSWLDRMAPGSGELHDPLWMARFRLHRRVSNKYRDGRLFLAGDAAHIHSPAGNQGMNTGIQDAVNLGWKLARVVRGEKADHFLDSYNDERRPVGMKLLNSSDRMFSLVSSNSRLWHLFRNLLAPWLLPRAFRNDARRNHFFRFLSQLGVRYRNSAIVGTAVGFAGPVNGGNRAPDGEVKCSGGEKKRLHQLLTPANHHLLLFSGVEADGRASEAALMRAEMQFRDRNPDAALVHTLVAGEPCGKSEYVDVDGGLHKRFGLEKTSGYAYIRPDGYIAHIGPLSSLEEFMNWQ
ncbi:FAD binding domain-containing protein [Apiospora arundinis]